MKYAWALPIGHENPAVELVVGRTFQQPVADRDEEAFASWYEFYLNPANNGAAIYTMAPGLATYTHGPNEAGEEVGELTIAVIPDFALALQDTPFFKGICLGKVIYGNLAHATFIAQLEVLIRAYYASPQDDGTYNILRTAWKGSTLLAHLNTFSDAASLSAEINAFIQSVILPSNTAATPPIQLMPFIVAAGNKIGEAGSYKGPIINIDPKLTRKITVAAHDYSDNYFDIALLLKALISTSYGRLRLFNDFNYLSAVTPDADKFNSSMAKKLGVTATSTHEEVAIVAGQKKLPLKKDLFDWHHGAKSYIEWRYDEDDALKLKAQVRNKTLDKTAPNDSADPTLMQGYHIRTNCSATTTKGISYLNVCLQENANVSTFVETTYNNYKDLLNNYGLLLGVPTEILIAIAYHESKGSLRAIRFEHLTSAARKDLVDRKEFIFIQKYDKMIEPLPDTVIKRPGKKDIIKKHRDGHSTTLPDFSADPSALKKNIRTIKPDKDELANGKPSRFNLTWEDCFKVLDSFSPIDNINKRISVGITQTLISTAADMIGNIQKKKDFKDKLVELGLADFPPNASDICTWLCSGINSLKAGATKMRSDYLSKNHGTRWDLPVVDSYYNDGGTPTTTYASTSDRHPNPWGYNVDAGAYYIDTAQAFNAARAKAAQLKFSCVLVKEKAE
jgi:hypothetical protein